MFGLTERRGSFDSTNLIDDGVTLQRSYSGDSCAASDEGRDGARRVTRSTSPDPQAFEELRRRAPSAMGDNARVQPRSLLDGAGSDDEDSVNESRRSFSSDGSNVAAQEHPEQERSVVWDALADVGGRFKDWIVGVASKFAAVGEIVGVIVGGVAAFGLAAVSIGIIPCAWNAFSSPGDDYITSFLRGGATAGKYIGGAIGGVVGVATSVIGVPAKAAYDACSSAEGAGYARVGHQVELDELA